MSDVYYIIGGVAYGIFILQFIISWVAGELDVDVDFDGDADFDIGDVVSFELLKSIPFKKTFKEMFVEDKKDNPTEDNFEAVK